MQFTQQENVSMLWEVISDEEVFRFLSRDLQNTVYQLFLNNIQGFYQAEKAKTQTLVDMNKKYVLLILNHIKQHYGVQPNKITIYKEPVKESITFEEIQQQRLSKFEQDLHDRRENFDQFMNVKPPPVPDFKDTNVNEGPIKEMDKMLKEIQSQRNYDIEQINQVYNTSSEVNNWLKPQETSLKPNKQMDSYSNPDSLNPIKKIVSFNDVNQIIHNDTNTFNNNTNATNNITDNTNTFANNTNSYANHSTDMNDDEDVNIFSKLKKTDKTHEFIKTYELTFHNRIMDLERSVSSLHEKMDTIIRNLHKIQ